MTTACRDVSLTASDILVPNTFYRILEVVKVSEGLKDKYRRVMYISLDII